MSTLTGSSLTWASATAANRKGRLAIGVLLCLLLAIAYAPVLTFTAHILLTSEDMAQGLFAPIVAIYIAWTCRRRLAAEQASGFKFGLLLLCLATGIQIWSGIAGSMTLSRSAFLISLAGCIVLLFGLRGLRTLLFPLALLLFTFPISPVLYGEVTAPLQALATGLSTLVFDGLGVTAVRDGNIIQLPSQALSIIEACSGLRSLLTLLFFTLTYVYFFEPRRIPRALVVSFSIPAAIVLNVLRITVTGLLAEKVSPRLSYGLPHEVLGWSCFFAGVVVIVLIHTFVTRRIGNPPLRSTES